jgi:phosphoribosylformylglycinamidine synthase II
MNIFLMILTEGESSGLLYWITPDPGSNLSLEQLAERIELLKSRIIDSVDQTLHWLVLPTHLNLQNSKIWAWQNCSRIHLQKFKSGVTDNSANSFYDLLTSLELPVHSVKSGMVTFLKSEMDPLPYTNPLIDESVVIQRPSDSADYLLKIERFITNIHDPIQQPDSMPSVEHFKIAELSTPELEQLSKDHFWALTAAEMVVIQKHYQDTLKGRQATDVEMEVFAQTWSEHCKHKIFAANINYTDAQNQTSTIRSLFKTFIEQPTFELMKVKPWAISVFKDNAGIVRFHEDVDLCIKVETHNSPSALDPYGGALTGILGVNRDILGTGLGARPIANTNVLCFGDPNEAEALPVGLHHPSFILKGVHKGIQDGGNKSGIPTVNGAMFFDESFSGKPLVFCGTVGVLPQTVAGLPSASKNQKAGDAIVMIGGAVGMDGLHGATSSSLAMDHTTPSSMVQIGDPLTQKRVMDFLLEARDLGLYHSVTDNGAGGLSSSIGEMSEATGGAKVYLDRVPLKYPGLKPWQIFVSESQERMTLAVPQKHVQALLQLSKKRSVISTVVGEFTDTGYLELFYQNASENRTVGKIDLKFLHSGLPKMNLDAKFLGPQAFTDQSRKPYRWKKQVKIKKNLTTLQDVLLTLAADPSLASKQKWVRQFDHEVQGATAVKPFDQHSPNDAGVIWMGAHGNKGFSGAAVASGMASEFAVMDGFLAAQLAADEAVRNLVVTGVDPDRIALIDNFSWPDPLPGPSNPDAEMKLGCLVRSCQGLAELVRTYQMPLISGKDSMKNDFIGKRNSASTETVKISVLPTLLVTALGYHPDVRQVIKPHAKPGSILVLLGMPTAQNYFGTSLLKYYQLDSELAESSSCLSLQIQFYKKFYQATQAGKIKSAHDLSEGGLLFALFESLMLHRGSITLNSNPNTSPTLPDYFNETAGRILISVLPEDLSWIQNHFQDQEQNYVQAILGEVQNTQKNNSAILIAPSLTKGQMETINLTEVEKTWRSAL